MNFQELKEMDNDFVLASYARFDIAIEKGEDSLCTDYNGKQYIDFSSGIGVNSLGFCDTQWADAVSNQAHKLNHTSNLFYTSPCAEVAKILCERTFAKKVFFSNSGAEANECAIKTARKYSKDKYHTNKNEDFTRYEILTLKNSFHGRTLTTLSATGQDVFHKNFSPFTQGFCFANPDDFDDFLNKVNKNTCAVMIELIQGEGGVFILGFEYVKRVTKYCKDNDILLIIDEVQTGIGRTGKLFCYENFDITPDIITTAKGLGGGLPIGACLFGEKTQYTLSFGDHGSTFGGNPICCAGAKVVLEKIDDQMLCQINLNGNYIKEKLLEMKNVLSVNQMGLMIGITLDNKDAKQVAKSLIQHGLLVLTAKDKLRLLPPLTIKSNDICSAIEILKTELN